MKLTGSEIVIQCLLEQKVDTVFGYPGGAILEIYDALYRHSDEICHIRTSHEQGAAHAADGYARATGKVGVCLATSGPGATNLVTGIATAYMDSVPMVAITCNVTLPLLGKDSFQEVDIAGISMPVTKHGYIVKDIRILAETIRKAFRIARSGRPGPVLVDITKDVTAGTWEYEPEEPEMYLESRPKYTADDLEKAADMIRRSKKPFIMVGGGAIASGASAEVYELAHKIQAPVCDTLMGKGAFPGDDPLYTGMIGMHGTKASNLGVSECDLLIALGARFSDRVIGNAKKFASGAKILHLDIDNAEINKNIRVDLALTGDLKGTLQYLNGLLQEKENSAWNAHIQELKEKYPAAVPAGRFTCPEIIRTIDAMTADDTIMVTDVGQHQMWTAQYYTYRRPRTLLTSGGLGTMGYGLGAAIGAKCAFPDRTVINIGGDGCFRMNMNELMTASRYQIPVIEVVINNHVLGMVRQWQGLFYGKRYSQTMVDDPVDYCRIAEGMGCLAFRATTGAEFEKALQEALASGRPCVIDCIIDQDDKVFPMVSPGASIRDTFDENDLKEKEA